MKSEDYANNTSRSRYTEFEKTQFSLKMITIDLIEVEGKNHWEMIIQNTNQI